MKRLFKYAIISAVFLMAVACSESTEPNNEESISNTKQTFTQIDQMMMQLINADYSEILISMPDISGIFGGQNRLSKSNPFSGLTHPFRVNNVLDTDDDSPFLMLYLLSQMSGTFSYTDTGWIHTETPSNALILEYSDTNQVNESVNQIQIKIFSISVSNSMATLNLETRMNGTLLAWTNVNIEGSNFLSVVQSPQITKIISNGGVHVNTLGNILYQLNTSNTLLEMSFGLEGQSQIIIKVEGTNLLDMNLDTMDNSNANVAKIIVTYGALSLVIDNPEAESGDIGDILYNGSKVADIVEEDGNIKIIFIDGEENTFAGLLPNISEYMSNR